MWKAVITAAILAMWSPLLPAGNWEILHDESTLGFTAVQQGSRFNGTFAFDAEMTFNADRVEDSEFDVTVDVTSVNTRSRDRDQALSEPEWFWFERYPEARFRTSRIEHVGGDEYEATADLTIRENTHEIALPFTWKEDGDTAELSGSATAVMEGGLTMDRLRWEVGTGEWAEDGTIGQEVDVHVDLRLRRRD